MSTRMIQGPGLSRVVEMLRLGRSGDPNRLRRLCVETLMQVTEATAGGFLEWGLVDNRPVAARRRLAGSTDWTLDTSHHDPRRPDPRCNRRFVARGREMHFTVYDRGEHVAWIGVARTPESPPFGRRELRRLAPLAGKMADALIEVRARERAAAPPAHCDLVIGPAGRIQCVSERNHPVVRDPEARAGLAAWARSIDAGGTARPPLVDGHTVRWSALHGRATVLHLLHLEPIPPLVLAPTSALSPTQREVAQLAAAGATAPEIAHMLKLSPSTIRTHLRMIYRSLEVCSRAELARTVGQSA